MVALSISLEGAFGLTWSSWQQLVPAIERLGFDGLFLSDHFVLPHPLAQDSLELIVALTYLADHTERLHFGSMVSPLTFRDPVMLARQAAALDDLSGGRMILGVGAGWNEAEHSAFGYTLGSVSARMDRLEEGLEVITRLLRGEAPASYAGRIFQLREALLLPRTALTGGPPILVGGVGPRRTLPLVARFANIWNANTLSADTFRERSQLLDRMLEAEGRAPGAIRRTVNLPIVCGETRDELETRVRGIRRWGYFAKTPLDELLASAKAGWACLVGTPDEIVSQIEAYAAAGVEEVMLQWFDVDDIEGLTVIADEVLPHVRAF